MGRILSYGVRLLRNELESALPGYGSVLIDTVGDGVTNNTATFSAFETVTTGKSVDLQGKTCVVDTIPIGNDYYNGAFKVGAEVYSLNKNSR